MLNFGKYKGKSLEQIIEHDKQYLVWIANNIQDIDTKLDEEDANSLFKYSQPYEYIKQKYGVSLHSSMNLTSKKEDEIICLLIKEGLVKRAHTYSEDDGGVGGVVETFYGTTLGTSICLSNVSLSHYDLISRICEHLDKANEWFKDYIARKAENLRSQVGNI
jgi:hypothetical protein